ncbi:uncharacterized protein LOC128553599 [Mercenaria mercenaria]|uniref:uncharacterized protein LOC128553599 n=1 Tax=Mercenaria mercenaria TaxID=6596 RepID=UPI00234F4604|nr:uncharacterized protein LOC128553599 [Mercenaria mercenaria]
MSEYNICEPCLREGTNVTATIYCQDCLEIMCEDCRRHHLKYTPSADHRTSDIAENKIQLRNLEEMRKSSRCPNHVSEQVKYLCKNHDELCCNQCAIATHRKCEFVVSLADKAKKSSSGIGIKTRLTDIDKHIDILLKHENKYVERSEQSVEETKNILKTFKAQIDETYAKLENEILTKMTKGSKDTIEASNSQQTCLKEVKDDVKWSLNSLDFASKFGQDVHSYLVKKKLKDDCLQKEDSVRTLQTRSSNKTVEVIEKMPVKELLDQLYNCMCADEVVENLYLPQCPGPTGLNKRQPVLIKEIDVGHGQSFPRFCIWIGKYIVIALEDEMLLKSFDSETGDCIATYNCPHKAREMAALEGSMLAVFCRNPEILKLSKTHFQHINTINSKSHFGGIAYNRAERQLYVSQYGRGTLEKFYLDGSGAGLMNPCYSAQEALRESTNIAFDSINKVLYISYLSSNNIYAVDSNGTILFTYRHRNLYGTKSVSTDCNSNIYIVSRSRNCIQQVDKNGVFIRDIITESNGNIKNPYGISLNDQNTRLAVTCKGEKQLKIYSFEK